MRGAGDGDVVGTLSTEAAADATHSLAASGAAVPASPSPIDVALGEIVDRYQVRRLLGTGGMGHVYLARDAMLGRSVALKLVAASADTERFLREARAIAALNHPNIVQLYDFGEHRGSVFLALEYVDGTTLRDRMRGDRIPADEALRHARAIADALAHAHAHGVIHCDLKPNNVMLGRDGRLRIVDFGIARMSDDVREERSGTPRWMAPEQWRGATVTDRVDSWALGILAGRLLGGDDAPAPPRAVADLIVRAQSLDPRARPSALEWKRVLDDVLDGRAADVVEGPYPGLAAFDEARACLYVGRERETDEFLERLRDTPCLPIVGPSGVGKSSFLHAGVIPRLRAREPWTVIALRPGRDPVGTLARQVVAAARADRAESAALRAELLETPTLLAARLTTIAATCETRVLVAVDQLEEAFTQCASERESARFVEMLLAATDDPLDPIRVVFTVRDDFLGRLAGLSSLFVMRQLGVAELRRTIVEPLARSGYDFDDLTVIDDLVAELGRAEIADLPLLQFACRTLWERRDPDARRLCRAAYDDMGGIAGALARHAERALSELSPEEYRTARRLLLQLVTGTTRRSVSRDHLVASVGADAETVIDRLLAARLLVQRTIDSEAVLIEIAHESLLQTWSQLARWIAESREERQLLEDLEDATSLWERRGRRADETWGPADLMTARHRVRQLGLVLPDGVQRFLTAGEARSRAQRRRRRIRYGGAFTAIGLVAIAAFMWIGSYLERERLIRTNAGTLELVLAPFDGGSAPAPIDQLPDLAVTLHATAAGDPHTPGEPIPARLVDILRDATGDGRRTLRVRAPGGMTFLRVDGRGRPGERCAPSWIRVQAFPGYAEANAIAQHAIEIPTCRATWSGTVAIEAGPFAYGGPGERPSARYGTPDYTEPRAIITLPRYAIDRTEVSNSSYAPFAKLKSLTGYPPPIYSNDEVHINDGKPEYPVSAIDSSEAAAFCRYMGKQLPSDHQWTKAARGGLTIRGAPNRLPDRLYPWGDAPAPRCANQAGLDDGFRWVAPVTSFDGPCASPYGVLNLTGNVLEWIAREGQTDRSETPQHALRGGAANSPPELEHITTIYRNHAAPRFYSYAIGVRCVDTAPP